MGVGGLAVFSDERLQELRILLNAKTIVLFDLFQQDDSICGKIIQLFLHLLFRGFHLLLLFLYFLSLVLYLSKLLFQPLNFSLELLNLPM